MAADQLARVLARLDALNRDDPTTVPTPQGPQPSELRYAERLTAWVLRLAPDASEMLRIAARGQHVRRWTIPRDHYPAGRAGYLKWRETLKRFHADTVADVMRAEGCADKEIARVRELITKQRLGADPETQVLEDALCLIFLESQFGELRRKASEPVFREAVRKTWAKMSPAAQLLARTLPMAPEDRRYLDEVLRRGAAGL